MYIYIYIFFVIFKYIYIYIYIYAGALWATGYLHLEVLVQKPSSPPVPCPVVGRFPASSLWNMSNASQNV